MLFSECQSVSLNVYYKLFQIQIALEYVRTVNANYNSCQVHPLAKLYKSTECYTFNTQRQCRMWHLSGLWTLNTATIVWHATQISMTTLIEHISRTGYITALEYDRLYWMANAPNSIKGRKIRGKKVNVSSSFRLGAEKNFKILITRDRCISEILKEWREKCEKERSNRRRTVFFTC